MKRLGAKRIVLVAAVFAIGVTIAADSPRQAAEVAYVRWQNEYTATMAEKTLMEEFLFLPESGQPRTLDETGGPDPFGYYWVDNQGSDTAVFRWVELCGDTAAQYGPTGDDGFGAVAWSFPFPFYGQTYTSAYININGKLTFQSGDGAWLNTCITTDATQPTINVHWDDLVAQQTGDCIGTLPRIKYRDFGSHLVIEWRNAIHFPNSSNQDRFSFEVILYSDGRICMQYDSLNCWAYCNSTTVSIDIPGPGGLQYVCSGSPEMNRLTHGRAVWFYPTPAPAPQALVVRENAPDIVLNWETIPAAASYNVYRSSLPDVDLIPANLLANVSDTTFTDAVVLTGPADRYFYAVTSVSP